MKPCRLIQQYPALRQYFLKDVAKRKNVSASALEIIKLLNDTTMYSELLFVIESADAFESFNRLFQSSSPVIHILYSEIEVVFKKILSKIYKPAVLKEMNYDNCFS